MPLARRSSTLLAREPTVSLSGIWRTGSRCHTSGPSAVLHSILNRGGGQVTGMSQTGLSHNLLANFAGSAWVAVAQLVAVPLYVRMIGVEGYALVGFYA